MIKPDLASTNHGTIISIRAVSARGQLWLGLHNVGKRVHFSGGPTAYISVDYDHRSGIDILLAALAAGLKLRDETSGVTVDRNTSAYDKYRTDVLDPRD